MTAENDKKANENSKKTNPWLWVGCGCGVVLVMFVLALGTLFLVMYPLHRFEAAVQVEHAKRKLEWDELERREQERGETGEVLVLEPIGEKKEKQAAINDSLEALTKRIEEIERKLEQREQEESEKELEQ